MRVKALLSDGRFKAVITGLLFFVTTALFFLGLNDYSKYGVIAAAAIVYGLLAYSEASTPPEIDPEGLLGLMLKSVYGQDSSHYRAVVHVWHKPTACFRAAYSYGMEGARDRHLEIRMGQWCTGIAWQKRVPVPVDLDIESPESYGMKGDRIRPGMKAALAIPIITSEGADPKCILTIDTDLPIGEAGFKEIEIANVLGTFGEVIGSILP